MIPGHIVKRHLARSLVSGDEIEIFEPTTAQLVDQLQPTAGEIAEMHRATVRRVLRPR